MTLSTSGPRGRDERNYGPMTYDEMMSMTMTLTTTCVYDFDVVADDDDDSSVVTTRHDDTVMIARKLLASVHGSDIVCVVLVCALARHTCLPQGSRACVLSCVLGVSTAASP